MPFFVLLPRARVTTRRLGKIEYPAYDQESIRWRTVFVFHARCVYPAFACQYLCILSLHTRGTSPLLFPPRFANTHVFHSFHDQPLTSDHPLQAEMNTKPIALPRIIIKHQHNNPIFSLLPQLVTLKTFTHSIRLSRMPELLAVHPCRRFMMPWIPCMDRRYPSPQPRIRLR
jgi:hypothetical protein